MSFTELFIKRPVLATILNLLIVVVGVLAYRNLTVREYPQVSIPEVSVNVSYPNASAQIVESSLTRPLEEQLAAVAGLESITSSSIAGGVNISLKFRPGTSMDKAMALIRDAVGLARGGTWPKDAREPLIVQIGKQPNAFLWLSVSSKRYNFEELTHLVKLHLKNQLQTIPGVASTLVMGAPYTMVVSLDRLKMFQHGISVEDVTTAIAKNQVSLPAGKFLEEVPVTLKYALEKPEDFSLIVVKSGGRSIVLLKDVAETTLVGDKRHVGRLNGEPAVFVGIVPSSDGNPLDISNAVRRMLPTITANMSSDVSLEILVDEATFIRSSLSNIRNSILEASLLVLVIIFLFLRNIRSTLIPLITIPISLIGTLAFVSMWGFSINTISLLALVLAVGLVVDDAIVILENIHRHIEKGLSPLQAALKGSREIAFAIIAMTLTLASVYAPMAFMSGVIGQLFIEFALTLAGAVVVSGIVALTLSPMMCSKLLRGDNHTLLPQIDRWLNSLTQNYRRVLDLALHRPLTMLIALTMCLVVCGITFWSLPGELAPKEDRGVIGAAFEPFPGKPIIGLIPYAVQAENIFKKDPNVKNVLTFTEDGGATVVALLKDWSVRKRHSETILDDARPALKSIPSAALHEWSWDSALPGVERDPSGTGLMIDVTTTGSYKDLGLELDKLQKSFEKDGVLTELHHNMHLDSQELEAKVDRHKMALLEIEPSSVAKAMETLFDQNENLEFLKDGLRYRVTLKGDAPVSNLHEVYVVSATGAKVPLSTFVELVPTALPRGLPHVSQQRSASFGGQLAKGQSLTTALDYLRSKMANELPANYSYQLKGAAKLQQESSGLMLLLFMMALVFIYCVMAIQFESFTDPLIILLTVPLASCGAFLLMRASGQSINIFSQIGLITLIGLISKHGILIVDFANQRRAEGLAYADAILEAATLRLRPVLMTTGAMVFGSIPLMLASGAGAEARRAIGIVLVGGLTFGTVLTLFVIPVVYGFMKGRR